MSLLLAVQLSILYCGRLCFQSWTNRSSVNPAILRYFYRDLTVDAIAANVMVEEDVNTRVKGFLRMEPDDFHTTFDIWCPMKKKKMSYPMTTSKSS